MLFIECGTTALNSKNHWNIWEHFLGEFYFPFSTEPIILLSIASFTISHSADCSPPCCPAQQSMHEMVFNRSLLPHGSSSNPVDVLLLLEGKAESTWWTIGSGRLSSWLQCSIRMTPWSVTTGHPYSWQSRFVLGQQSTDMLLCWKSYESFDQQSLQFIYG